MRTTLLALVLVLVCANASLAQTGTPTSWNLRIFSAGTLQSGRVVTSTQVACNQAVPATTATENPTRWIWDDVSNAGRVCIFVDDRLPALADGAYEGTAQAINADGASSESARVPFSRRRPNPPAVPTGLRLSQ